MFFLLSTVKAFLSLSSLLPIVQLHLFVALAGLEGNLQYLVSEPVAI